MPTNTAFRVCVSSPPDRDKLVAEIFFGSIQWAEVSQEFDEPEVEIYPRPDGEPWRIKLEHLNGALALAQERLFGST